MAAEETLQTLGEKAPAPELRLLDRRAFVGFPPLQVQPGLVITDFALQIPDATFPFNVSVGPGRYQKKKLHFGVLEVSLDAELIKRSVAQVAGRLLELTDLKLDFRVGYLEGQARLKGPEPTPVTFKIAFDGDGERLAVHLYDVRLYGFSPTPVCQVPLLLTRSVVELELLPDVGPLGATGFTSRVLPPLCQMAAVGRGFKMPALDGARLSGVDVSPKGLKLRFTSGGLPPPTTPDEELLLALEGVSAFADAEALIAEGRLADARDAYLKASDPAEAHPFAAERLLGLLVADPQAHELALDVAGALARRRDKSPVALWAEAVVRERRGEAARAAERYLALAALSRKYSEETAAFFAAESAARAAEGVAPQLAVKALHEVLGLRPDHLPSLMALARAADQANDRAGAIRAYRRISALARDPLDAAEAHVQLSRLCALTEDDVAGARLHCEAALRLAPDHPEALYQLGELCHRAGEHLRALKALDRLKEVALARHELDRVGRAQLLAGRVWEVGLKQLDNALLRYREAVSLLPARPEPLFSAAQVAESLGRVQEAVSGYVQAVELAGPNPASAEARSAAYGAHRALAKLYKTRLSDIQKSREHLEAAFRLDAGDPELLEELIPALRAMGKAAELAEALERAAQATLKAATRASFLSEAAELYRGRLGDPDRAEKLLHAALEADGGHRPSLEALLALAESRRDGAALCRALEGLAALAQDPKERARYHRRLVVAARDVAFDLELAARALREVLKAEPEDLTALGDLCALQRKRSDMAGLAEALELRARVAEHQKDVRLAAACLRELAQVLEVRLGRPGEALVALEKAARLAPEHAVLMELADISMRCERPQHARRALEDVLAGLKTHASPERLAEVHARLGKACDLLGDREAAVRHYGQALPLRRLDDELASRLEALYLETGRSAELAELWSSRAQALLSADRPEAAAPLLLKSAKLLLEEGQREPAFHKLTSALELSPNGPHAAESLELLAGLELARGNRLESAKLYAREAALVAEPRAAARIFLKAAGLVAGSPREDEFLFDALRRDATFAPARARRGELLLSQAPARALDELSAALESTETGPDGLLPELRAALHRKAAAAALELSRTDAARHHLTAYVAEKPDDVEALTALARLHRQAGAVEPLETLLQQVAHKLKGAEALSVFREHAELAIKLGRVSGAVRSLREVLSADPDDLWAAATLWGLLSDRGVDAEPGEPMRLLSLLVTESAPEERGSYRVERARLYQRLSRPNDALDDLLLAAQESKDPGALYQEAANLARTVGDEARELSAWRGALKAEPAMAEVAAVRLKALALSRLSAGDYRSATDGLLEVVQLPLPPDDLFDARLSLATAARGMGDLDAGLKALAAAAREGPASRRPQALVARVELAREAGRFAEAAESLEALLAAEPAHPDAGVRFRELGRLYLDKLDAPLLAEPALVKAAALLPDDVEVRRGLFGVLVGRQAWSEVARVAGATARELPKEAAAGLLRDVAARCAGLGRDETALTLLETAHALVPARGEALLDLAERLHKRGALEEALPVLARAAEQVDFEASPERAESLLVAYGEAAEQARDLAAAERTYRRVLKERPGSSAALERLAALVGQKSPRAGVELLADFLVRAPPSDAVGQKLIAAAARAHAELADVELAARLLRAAAPMVEAPLLVHQRLVGLLRESGRTVELMEALKAVASHCLSSDDLGSATTALEEEAVLAESMGRPDEALQALQQLSELASRGGQPQLAAGYERRRAELHRDLRRDAKSAEGALERAFELYPEVSTAQLGAALAHQQKDPRGQARWLRRELDVAASPKERSAAGLKLAKLSLEVLKDRAQGEAGLRAALKSDASSAEAEQLLARLLEEDGRLMELGAFYEELAAQAAEPRERAQWLKRAAVLYRDRVEKPGAAATAFVAARAADPSDLSLAQDAADALAQAGREPDAAELDAVILKEDPLRMRSFERHLRHLTATGEHGALASLWLARAQAEEAAAAAQSYLSAARAFRAAGADERAAACELKAFDEAPALDEAFEAARAHAGGDLRRLSEVLAKRAHALPAGGAALLKERARKLTEAHESIAAAEAWDELLSVAPDDTEALLKRADLAAEAGGPRAAQPYDRRLIGLAVGTEPWLTKVRLRLGHASLATNAFKDAAESLEAVVELDPGGDRGREALSLLAEVYAKQGDDQGLYRTSLLLARAAEGDEAEALYRRAADLAERPEDVVDALLALAALRPADEGVVDRAVQALEALGRTEEQLAVLERAASAIGGPRAAELLLAAAGAAERSPKEEGRAAELLERAAALAPDHLGVLLKWAERQRSGNDRAGLVRTLTTLVALRGGSDEGALERLELAQLHLEAGAKELARCELVEVWRRGPKGAGYAQALALLAPLLGSPEDSSLRSDILAAQAELAEGAARAELLLKAANAAREAKDLPKATRLCRAALAAEARADAYKVLAALWAEQGDPGRKAQALVQAAGLSPEAERPPLLLEAAEAWVASGDPDEARELLERVSSEYPEVLPRDALMARLVALGAGAKAVALGFAPLMQKGAYAEALALAEAAGDHERAHEALWALAETRPDAVARLASAVAASGTEEEKERLALLAEAHGATAVSATMARSILDGEGPGPASVPRWEGALDRASAAGDSEQLLLSLASRLTPGAPEPWAAAVLGRLSKLSGERVEEGLAKVAESLPARRRSILEELLTRAEGRKDFAAAASRLEALTRSTEDAQARASLELRLGELYLNALKDADRGVGAFERALASDGQSLAAVRQLMGLYRGRNPARYVELVERLELLEGPAAAASEQEALVQAYEALGRPADAYRALSALPATRERLFKRAALAEGLGLLDEALDARAALAHGSDELTALAESALAAGRTQRAVALVQRLFEAGQLSGAAARSWGARLAETEEGAWLSATLLQRWLSEAPSDPTAWLGYAGVLGRLNKPLAAELAKGIGAALSGSDEKASVLTLKPLERAPVSAPEPVPPGAVPITKETMPRLELLLSMALTGLGVDMVQLWLDPAGGPEAYLAAEGDLVLGAGALAHFGAVELTYLMGLVLTLGDESRALKGPTPLAGLAAAALKALEGIPASLAAGRVLARLDPKVRGTDMPANEALARLPDNPAFLAICQRVLEL